MMPGRPTKTINRLHFTDLDPTRFEDLCLALIYPLHPWADIQHHGRLGGDGGVDISATETSDEKLMRDWIIQCRRYNKATKATLERAVDDALANTSAPPQVLLVVLACDVTRAAHEAYTRHARERGVAEPLLWTASAIEARLYSERKDLLFTYFGISLHKEPDVAAVVRHNLAMKRKAAKELLRKNPDPGASLTSPREIFAYGEAIIRSIDDQLYPIVDEKGSGISSWFKIEFFDLYHKGIEFVSRVKTAMMSADGRWAIVPYGETEDRPNFTYFPVYLICRLPYKNIVEIDRRGDEYYPFPHIYCRFANDGEPWEELVYRYATQDGEYPAHLDEERHVAYEDLVKES
jgi:restriction endonuclease